MKITDELLYLNVSSARDEWFSLSMKDNLKYEHDFSHRFKRKIRKLIRQNKDKVNYKSFRPAIVWSLVAVIFLSGTTAYAYRDNILNVAKKVKSELTEYRYSSEVDMCTIDSVTLGYITDGFDLVDSSESPSSYYYRYVNREDETKDIVIIVDVYSKQTNGTMILDTEDAIVTEIMIGNLQGEYIEKGENIQLLWSDENCVIWIAARAMEKDELIRIAENIIINQKAYQ
jgi:hypothetical protein